MRIVKNLDKLKGLSSEELEKIDLIITNNTLIFFGLGILMIFFGVGMMFFGEWKDGFGIISLILGVLVTGFILRYKPFKPSLWKVIILTIIEVGVFGWIIFVLISSFNSPNLVFQNIINEPTTIIWIIIFLLAGIGIVCEFSKKWKEYFYYKRQIKGQKISK